MPIMENHMDKEVENEMEADMMYCVYRVQILRRTILTLILEDGTYLQCG